MMRDSEADATAVITRNIMASQWEQILRLASYQGFWQWYITLRITRFLDFDNCLKFKNMQFQKSYLLSFWEWEHIYLGHFRSSVHDPIVITK